MHSDAPQGTPSNHALETPVTDSNDLPPSSDSAAPPAIATEPVETSTQQTQDTTTTTEPSKAAAPTTDEGREDNETARDAQGGAEQQHGQPLDTVTTVEGGEQDKSAAQGASESKDETVQGTVQSDEVSPPRVDALEPESTVAAPPPSTTTTDSNLADSTTVPTLVEPSDSLPSLHPPPPPSPTPPTPSASPSPHPHHHAAPKKFQSSLAVNKKFLAKGAASEAKKLEVVRPVGTFVPSSLSGFRVL